MLRGLWETGAQADTAWPPKKGTVKRKHKEKRAGSKPWAQMGQVGLCPHLVLRVAAGSLKSLPHATHALHNPVCCH